MHNKNLFNLTLITFFLALFSVLIYWIIEGGNQQTSLIEIRPLAPFTYAKAGFKTIFSSVFQRDFETAKEVIIERLFNRSFQMDIEKAASDQFPFRIQAIRLSKAVDRQAINLVYGFLPDPAIPTDMQSGIYIMRDKSRLIPEINTFEAIDKKMIDARIENYTSQISAYPNLNVYAFYLDQLSDSIYHPLDQYFPNADRGQSLAYFEDHKPVDLILGKMLLTSFEDHILYYYKTDHHWNIHGVLHVYYTIHDMLAKNYPDISSPIIVEDFITFPGIEYLGFYARSSLYPIQGEKFEVARYSLPPYKIFNDGQETIYNASAQYLAGDYSTEPYTNHYLDFFGHDKAFLKYVFDNNSKRNLLLIGSSFKNPLAPLIASHYHETFVIDLRYYKDFSLANFLSQYKVEDILLVGNTGVVFSDDRWMIDP